MTLVLAGSTGIGWYWSTKLPAFYRQLCLILHFVYGDREQANRNLKLFSTMAKHHPDLIFCRKQPGVGNIFMKFFSPSLFNTHF